MPIQTKPRRAAATVGALMLLALVAGCSDDAPIGSSSRGASSRTPETTVENAFLVPNYPPGSCVIQVGDTAALKFTATNNSQTETERLLGISTDAADRVVMTPPAPIEIPPGASVSAHQPVEQPDPADKPVTVTIEGLNEKARPGISVSFTFRFEKFGDLKMQVPIEACPTQS